MNIYKNDPNYEILYVKKSASFNGLRMPNQEGQQKQKITHFRISYKVNSKWNKDSL